jgi:hypothetical protein
MASNLGWWPLADLRKEDLGAAHLEAAAGGGPWGGGRQRTGGARVRELEAETKFWTCVRELEAEMKFWACAKVTVCGYTRAGKQSLRPLDPKFSPKFYYKKRFSITSKYRQIHEVLNIDKIKN